MRKKGFKRFLKENILEIDASNKTKALSIALGVFVGLTPFWGFQTVIVLFLATYFKLNKMLSYMSTHISFPPFIPFVIMISLYIGSFFVSGNSNFENQKFNLELAKTHFLQYCIGSLILASAMSLMFGFGSYFLLQKLGPNKNKF
jgi:uncharacterized protein (DUF2062 family)